MSHFVTIAVEFKDRECIIEALKALGLDAVEQGSSLPLYGYQGDRRSETADIVVRRQHLLPMSNDIGFTKSSDAYRLVISEYDRGALQKGEFVNDFTREYAKQKALKESRRLGYRLEKEQVEQDGTIRLVVRRW